MAFRDYGPPFVLLCIAVFFAAVLAPSVARVLGYSGLPELGVGVVAFVAIAAALLILLFAGYLLWVMAAALFRSGER